MNAAMIALLLQADCGHRLRFVCPPVAHKKLVHDHHATPFNIVVHERVYGIPTYNTFWNPYATNSAKYESTNNAEPRDKVAEREREPAWVKDLLEGFRVQKDATLVISRRLSVVEKRLGIEPPVEEPAPKAPGPMPMPKAEPNPFKPPQADGRIKFTDNRCASCHDKSIADTEGGKFVMFDGEYLALKPDKVSEVIRRVLLGGDHKQRMPKGPAWSAAEKGAFLERFGAAIGIGEEEPKDRK